MIIENRKRIRRDYQPLTTSQSLKILTPASAVSQVYDSGTDSFNPDRGITPLVIFPQLFADAHDGSWQTHNANTVIANMKWFVNGVDVATIPSWNGLYEIAQIGEYRGAITILRNTPVDEKLELHFEAILPDTRLGINIPIKTDSISLSTIDKAPDTYEMSIDVDPVIIYNPFLDKLLMYDYKIANGLEAGTRASALDANSYERTINMLTTRGGKLLLDNVLAVELYRNNNQTLTLIDSAPEIISISATKIVFDLRVIEKADYVIVIKIENKEVARQQISIAREYPIFTVEPLSGVSINPGEVLYRNVASVSSNGQIVHIPEPIVRLLWFTDTANKTGVEWQEGSRAVIEILRTGIGDTYLDDWMDIYLATEQKKAHNILTSAAGDNYVDNQGNLYINN